MTDALLAERLDLFYGGASPNVATIYARLPEQPTGQGLTLSGFVRGPHCLYSTMLPATIRLADAGPGESLLARVVVPDPCYWTEQLPALYDVHVELKQGTETVAAIDRTFGLRQFGARGKFLYQSGKRWTIRAARPAGSPGDLLDWHDTPLSFAVENPDDSLCNEASRSGVMVIAGLAGNSHHIDSEVRRLARHAAVAVIGIQSDEDLNVPALKQAAPNVTLACVLDSDAPREMRSGYDAAIVTLSSVESFAQQVATLPVPVIAWRRSVSPHASPAAARAACDVLQAELAPLGDFSGYVV